MIVLTTTVNLLGVRVISRINNIGVIAELVGAAGLIILLAINIKHGPSVLFETDGTGAGHDWGYARRAPARRDHAAVRDVRIRHGRLTGRGDLGSAAHGADGRLARAA